MSRSGSSLVPASEVSLVAVTLAVVLGFDRLFEGGEWLGPLVFHALVAHAAMALVRRRGLGLIASALVAVVGALVVTTWTTFLDTASFGLPTGATWDALGAELDFAWRAYQDVSAPAPALPGFVASCAAAVWIVAFVSDWAAFRVWVPFEATLPAATLFLFTALLGVPAGRGWTTAAFVGAVLAFILLHRTARRDGASHWVGDRRSHGHAALLRAGAALGTVAVVAGIALAPALPGADRPGYVDLDDLGGQPPRRTVSPLVDIRSRLVEQSNQVMFRVRSPEPAYWRLTSLDTFDGERWSSSTSFGDAGDELPVAVEPVAGETVEQEYEMERLSAIWLPAAFVPRSFEPDDDVGVLFHEGSATLIVDRESVTSDGITYRVASTSPRLTLEDLQGIGPDPSDDVARDNLALPDTFSPRVTELAQQLVAGTSSPFEAARRIQDHLRTFAYDQSIQPGHGDDALEAFLFDLQRGYCEQFAGAFAAMARSVGLPARVAVGFTPGEEDPDEPGTYVVRGVHAHAWPEVYLAGAGWVSFEPTPGRGQPFTEDYTGVPAAQASGDASTPVTLPPTTVPAPAPAEGDLPTPERPDLNELEADGGIAPTPPEDRSSSWLSNRFVQAGLAAVLLAVVLLGAGPAFRLWRRARRRTGATTPGERVGSAWQEVVDAATPLGYRPRRSATPDERAQALVPHVPVELAPLAVGLGASLNRALYSPAGADDHDAAAAEEAAHQLVAAMRERTPRRARIAWWLDPRDEVRAWRRERSDRQRHITGAVRGAEAP